MTTLKEIQVKVTNVEEALAMLTKVYAGLNNNLIKQEFQIDELRYQTAEMRQQTAELRQQTVEMRQQTADIQKQTAELRQQTADIKEQTAEIKRDCQQNRRLWIAIARKLDWLDLDEDFD